MPWPYLLLIVGFYGSIFVLFSLSLSLGASAIFLLLFMGTACLGFVHHRKLWSTKQMKEEPSVEGSATLYGLLRLDEELWRDLEQLNKKPFYIMLASGRELRIEPQEKLTSKETPWRNWRRDELVCLQGDLKMSHDPKIQTESYRDVEQTLVLYPTQETSLMKISSEESQAKHRREGRFFLCSAAVWALVCCVFVSWEHVGGGVVPPQVPVISALLYFLMIVPARSWAFK
jgi:hypothetical protein